MHHTEKIIISGIFPGFIIQRRDTFARGVRSQSSYFVHKDTEFLYLVSRSLSLFMLLKKVIQNLHIDNLNPVILRERLLVFYEPNLHRMFKVNFYIDLYDHNFMVNFYIDLYDHNELNYCNRVQKHVKRMTGRCCFFFWFNQSNLKYEASNALAFSHAVMTASVLPSIA